MNLSTKRGFCLLLAILVVLSAVVIAVAAEPETSDVSGESAGTSSEESSVPEFDPKGDFSSVNPAMAFCLDTEQVLYENGVDRVLPAGVITKMCALMVAYDLLSQTDRPLTTRVTIEEDWIRDSYVPADRSTPYLGIKAGEEYTLEYLFTTTLVAGASDACSAIVRYCASQILRESEQGFLAKMNEKAGELGMENTRFAAATGKQGASSMTTVRDAMKLLAAFYSYNDLVLASDCATYGTIKNKNCLKCDFFVSNYLNKSVTGLMAGQATNEGNYSVATYKVVDGVVYAYLVMGASGERIDTDGTHWFDPGNAYEDINHLIRWTDANYELMTLCEPDTLIYELRMGDGAETDHLILVPDSPVELLVFRPDQTKLKTDVKFTEQVYESEYNGKDVLCIDAPVKQGTVLGTITFLYDGKVLATRNLIARDSVEINDLRQAMSRIRSFLFDGPMSKIILIVAILVGLWILLALALFVYRIVQTVKKRKKSKNVNKL